MRHIETKSIYEVNKWNRENLKTGKRVGLFNSKQAAINYLTHFGHGYGEFALEHGGEVTPDSIFDGCVVRYTPEPSELDKLMGWEHEQKEEYYIINTVTLHL